MEPSTEMTTELSMGADAKAPTFYEDSLRLYQSVSAGFLDNLYWRLTYLNAAQFRTPNKADVGQILLSLYKDWEALVMRFYPSAAGRELVRRMDAANRLFTLYVERRCAGRKAQTGQTQQQWRENGRQMARLFSQLNRNWRQPEWSAMLGQSIQMMEHVAGESLAGHYDVFGEYVPLCQRLAVEMAEYIVKGLMDKHFV